MTHNYEELVQTIALDCLEKFDIDVADADRVMAKLSSVPDGKKKEFREKLIAQNRAKSAQKNAELDRKEAAEKEVA